jgi:uncharacterized protein (DUF1697 family)
VDRPASSFPTPPPTSATGSSTWVALLRAINLGRTRRVAMADLRAMLASLGYGDVRTHLQSGNALFTTPDPIDAEASGGGGAGGAGDAAAVEAAAARLEREIAARLAAECGFDVPVMVRSAGQLVQVVEANPFVARRVDERELHAAFLSAAPAAEAVAAIDVTAYAPDELVVGDRVAYLRRPNGIQGSRLPDLGKLLGVEVTERNWRTVSRLHALALGR